MTITIDQVRAAVEQSFARNDFRDIGMGGFNLHSTPNTVDITWDTGTTKAWVTLRHNARLRSMTGVLSLKSEGRLSLELVLPNNMTALDVLASHSVLIPLYDLAVGALITRVSSGR